MAKHPVDSINHDIFQFDPDAARLKLALLKENFEYRAFYEKLIKSIDGLNFSFPDYHDSNFSIPAYHFEKFGLPGAIFTWGGSLHEDVLDILDPFREVSFDSKKEDDILSKIFYWPAVMQTGPNARFEGIASWSFESIKRNGLKSYERLCVVDLRKKKKQILRELSEHIDSAYRYSDFYETDLKPDISRLRKESWTHLKVWKLRRKRMRFSEIAEELGLTEDNARKSFYKAHELTQFRPYNPNLLRSEILSVKMNELKKICSECDEFNTCTIECPEILGYVDQDVRKHTKEKLFSDIEYLL